MSSKQDLKKAVQLHKAKLERAADEQRRLIARLETDSKEFTQLVAKYLYMVDQDINVTEAREELTGPGGSAIKVTTPQITVLGTLIRLAPKINKDQLSFTLSDLGESVFGHIVRKDSEQWKVFEFSGDVLVSHFTEEYLIDRLIRRISSI